MELKPLITEFFLNLFLDEITYKSCIAIFVIIKYLAKGKN